MKATRVPLLRAVARLAVGAVLAIGPIVIGCNGDDDYFYGGGFGGSSTGGTYKTSADAGSLPEYCARAKADASCGGSQVTICEPELGSLPNPACNSFLECDTRNYQWEVRDPERIACAPAAACPAEYTQSADDLCARPDAISLICEYQEGTCGCAPVGGVTQPITGDDDDDDDLADAGADAEDAGDADAEAPDAEAPDAADAAPDAAAPDAGPRTYGWKCVAPRGGCPRTRPREGLRCVREITCDYGDGVFEDGVAMSCNHGTWTRDTRK